MFNNIYRYAPYAFIPNKPLIFKRGANFIPNHIGDRVCLGGQCCLTLTAQFGAYINTITPYQPGRKIDYYFPWIEVGIGACVVPRRAPKGTIVCTEGIQGCSIKVFLCHEQNIPSFLFVHDHDNCSLNADRKTLLNIGPDDQPYYVINTANFEQQQTAMQLKASLHGDKEPPNEPNLGPNFHSYVYFVSGRDFWYVSVSHVWSDWGSYHGHGHGKAPANLARLDVI